MKVVRWQHGTLLGHADRSQREAVPLERAYDGPSPAGLGLSRRPRTSGRSPPTIKKKGDYIVEQQQDTGAEAGGCSASSPASIQVGDVILVHTVPRIGTGRWCAWWAPTASRSPQNRRTMVTSCPSSCSRGPPPSASREGCCRRAAPDDAQHVEAVEHRPPRPACGAARPAGPDARGASSKTSRRIGSAALLKELGSPRKRFDSGTTGRLRALCVPCRGPLRRRATSRHTGGRRERRRRHPAPSIRWG